MSEVVRVGDVARKTFAAGDDERARREAAVLRHLAGRSSRVRIQSFVSLEGRVLETRWLEGRKKTYTEITEEEWRALGRELATLHDALEGLAYALPSLASFDVDREREAIESARVLAPAHGAYLDARLALLSAHAVAASDPPRAPLAPIHNDYNQHNFLFDGTSPPIVLDWDRALSAPREYEVVRCLNHLPLVARPHARAFVEGYRGERALDTAAIGWAVHRTLVDHATKRWPLERWLANPNDIFAEAALHGSAAIACALAEGTASLVAFYEEVMR